jgi:mono/diheme cytochrome c family protein
MSTPAGQSPKLEVVGPTAGALKAVAGDALALKVVQLMPGGATADLPATATVTWSGPPTVTALAAGSTGASPLPAPGATPTAVWIANPGRPERSSDLGSVLFVLDAGKTAGGTVSVVATVAGLGPDVQVKASIAIAKTPTGNATTGGTLYAAACAGCHGATGAGSPADATGNYSLAGQSYPYPAPALNAATGNLAADPTWNAALFAMSSRADIDNAGVTLRVPMTDCLAEPNPTTKQPFTTQDFANIFAFLKTQKK